MEAGLEKSDAKMDVSPILALLRKKIGLNPESLGTSSVEKVICEQIEQSGVTSVEDYLTKLNISPAELHKLIESIVIIETSFFRNTTPFVTLRSYLQQFVLNQLDGRPLRILCLPCSTGEEAYSIAMVLFEMHLSTHQFSIFAGDISEQVLQVAQTGKYNAYSFRGDDISFRDKYFTLQSDGTYLLKKEIRHAVHFEQANILSEHFLNGHQHYDIIFCRNLLIYFDDTAKEKAIHALLERLTKDGVLFVGHAEASNIPPFGLVSLDYPMSFAFARKKYATTINKVLNINNPIVASLSPPDHVTIKQKTAPVVVPDTILGEADKFVSNILATEQRDEIHKAEKLNLANHDIATAQRLADKGLLGEAAIICEKLLFEGVESEQLFYLLGQLASLAGDHLLAEEYLKKAVYLNADFYDALLYLAIVFEKIGKPEQATSFRKRAHRVQRRNTEDAGTSPF